MDFYEQVPKDFAENLRYRLKLRQRAEKDLRFREALVLACRADILFFLSAFCYLHEPRPMKDEEGRTLPEIIPFIPWAHQVPIIRTIRENIGFCDCGCEKARGEGMSWIAVYMALHDWIFAKTGTRMVSIGVVSRNLEMADSPDDPASLGWKFDWALKRLPKWMVGQEFSGKQKPSAVGWRRNMAEHTWRNLQNGSVITCYAATAETGSGGRYTYFILDELSKFQPGADKDALTSTQQTTKSRLIIGTPYGSEGAYYDVMHEPSSMVKLVLAWENNPTRNRGLYRMVDGIPMAVDRVNNPLLPRYDPPNQEVTEMFARLRRKGFRLEKGLRSEWYDKECDRPDANPYNIAQELDRDYGGSMYKIFGEEFFGAIAGGGTVRQPLLRVDVTYDDELKATVSKSHNGQLLLWMSLDVKNLPPDHTYVIGCDICTGLGGAYTSNSVMEIIDVTIGEQVGEMAVNTMKPDDFADYCMAVGKWLGGAYLNWERNGGPGSEFTKQVLNRRYTNVFFSSRMFERGKHKIKVPGWYSEDKSKPVMFAEFKQSVVSGELRIRSDLLVKECHQYINVGGRIVHIAVARRGKDKDGKDGPDQGQAHGDRVIALGVAVQAVRDRPINIDRDKDSKILPGSIEERDRMYHESQQDDVRGDDWDDRTNWDLMQGTKAGFVFN